MNYLQILQKGLRFVVKLALTEVEQHGLEDPSQIFITFKTKFPGVVMPKHLIEQYPGSVTVVLQHEFWNLKVHENTFSVDLVFSDVVEKIVVPFNAISRFEDPNEPFALDFIVDPIESDFPHKNDYQNKQNKDNIISLDEFRKNKDPKN